MTPPKWAPPVALVSGIFLIGVMAEVTKPTNEQPAQVSTAPTPGLLADSTEAPRVPGTGATSMMDELANDAPMEMKGGDTEGTRGVAGTNPSGAEAERAAHDLAPGRSVSLGNGVADRTPEANETRTEAPAKVAPVVFDTPSLCPQYRGMWCTSTPHTSLQCSDAKVAEWKLVESVWQIHCMNGTLEQRELGAWPEPVREESTARMKSNAPINWSTGVPTSTGLFQPSAPNEYHVVIDGKDRGPIDRENVAELRAWMGSKGMANVDEYLAVSLLGIGSESLMRQVSSTSLAITSTIPLEFGWHLAVEGNTFCPRSPRTGWCDKAEPAIPGTYYLAYAGLLTHVTLLPCADERVLSAIAAKWPNVTCQSADRKIAQYNVDPSKAEPRRIFSDHDRIGMGRVTELAK